MKSLLFILMIISVIVVTINGEEKFCEKDRKLLLGGVFNYDNIILAYSWKEVNSVQLWLIWRFKIQSKGLTPMGKETHVDNVFPGIPMFRTGFGLNLKCDDSDTKCKSYKELVFIFFQTHYKVYRFVNDKFTTEVDKTSIPWGLKERGEVSDWFFGETNIDNINGITFITGYQSYLFIVTKDSLYSSPVNVKVSRLKWTKLSQNKDFSNVLGGFVADNQLYFNLNQESDNLLIKYNTNGKEEERISVWKYFGCDNKRQEAAVLEPNGKVGEVKDDGKDNQMANIAKIVLICVVIAVIVTDIIASIFWLTVYRRKK